MRRRGWWLIGLAAVTALSIQAGIVAVVWRQARPRLPGVAAVVPTMDRVIADVVAAAGNDAAVAVSDLVPVTSCQHTPLAKGNRFSRTADLYTAPGAEDALIARIAGALPAADHARRASRTAGGAAPLTADPGSGVHLVVTEIDQGWVAAAAQTDCRTGRTRAGAGTPPAAASAALTDLFATLGTGVSGWHTDSVACTGGRIVTVDAVSQATATGDLPHRLAGSVPAGARTFTSPSNRLAWLDQTTSVIVAASDDGTHITAQRTTTGGC